MKKPLGDIKNFKLMFPSKYLASEDLGGKEVTVTIEEIFADELVGKDGERIEKWLVQFKGAKKLYVMNKTAGVTMAEMYGKDPHNWIGKAVTLYPTQVYAFGKNTDCIRIKATVPTTKPKDL